MVHNRYTQLEIETIPTFVHTLQFTVTYGFAERLSKEPPSALFTVASILQVVAALNVLKLWLTTFPETPVTRLIEILVKFLLQLTVMFCSNLVAQLISLSINEINPVWAMVLIAYCSLLLLAGAIGSGLTDLKSRNAIHMHHKKTMAAIMQ